MTLGASEMWPKRCCCPEAGRPPGISSVKMGFFKLSTELQLGVCSHGGPCAHPHMGREGEPFYGEEGKWAGLESARGPWLFIG